MNPFRRRLVCWTDALLKSLLFLLLWLPSQALSAEDRQLVYHLISDQQNADIDYPLLERLQRQQAKVAEELRRETPDDKVTAYHVGADDLKPLLTKPVKGTARVLTFFALSIGRYADPTDGKTCGKVGAPYRTPKARPAWESIRCGAGPAGTGTWP